MRCGWVVLVASGLAVLATAQSRSGDYGAWFLQRYGPAQPRDDAERWLLEDAGRVFERVAGTADRRLNRPPRLLMIEKPGVEAQALPDGTVVANLGLLRLCYGGTAQDRAAGRARLAFVLGHELAHLAHDDSWHAEAFAALRALPDARLRTQLEAWTAETPEVRQAKELHADEAGFVALVMAGYDPGAVLGPERDFLSEWAGGEAALGSHPSFAQRSQALRLRLRSLVDSVPYFRFGVRLVQLGRSDDALPLLRRALSAFPGREVESALGLAHYQRALARLGECGSRRGLRFLLPVALDADTLAARVRLRDGGPDECAALEAVRQDLSAARAALESALERDPGYLPARINLVAVLLQQDQPHEAFGKAREPGRDEPTEPRLALLGAVALFGLGRSVPGDATDAALDRLEALGARCAAAEDACDGRGPHLVAAAVFDRARILQERGRGAAAGQALRRFLELQPSGPWAEEARTVLRQMGERAGLAPASPPAPSPASLAERLGPEQRERLARATALPFSLGDVRGAFRATPGLQALELRGTIELVEERLAPPLEAAALRRELGAPPRIDWLEDGRVTWIYADSAYDVEDGRAARRVLFQGR